MSDLTPRQTQILRLIQRFISDTGMPPTRVEIARELGFKSANAAEEHLRALARKGVISLVPGTSRGIRLKDSLREQLGFGFPSFEALYAAAVSEIEESKLYSTWKIKPTKARDIRGGKWSVKSSFLVFWRH